MNLRYYPTDSSRPSVLLKTEIKHITRDEQGRFKGVYLVGLSILENRGAEREKKVAEHRARREAAEEELKASNPELYELRKQQREELRQKVAEELMQ